MNADILLKYFDRISEAPDAIPRLRRFILDLAVRGKLVEQDSRDEPASKLLKRIQAEKAKNGITPRRQGSKEGDKLGDLAAWREGDFEVPPSWERVRIRQITSDRGQTVPKTNFTYIDVTAINKEQGCLGETTILSAAEAPSRARKIVQQGDVIYSCVRPYLLNIAIIESEISPQPIASTAFAVLNGFGLTLPRYIWIVLRSPFIVEAVESFMRGQAYPAINDSDFAQLPFPLPPLAEQQRIVAKVDELMALCDQLEAARNERETRRQRLTAASLQRLNQPADAASLRTDARFHLDNLTRLTTRPEQIKQLRQTILNLAVRGCLVPQDPKDEPASELLKRIQTEKARLVKTGEIRKPLPLPVVAVDKIPFSTPATWRWIRFGDLIQDADSGWSPKTEGFPRTGNNWGVLKVSAVSWGRFLPEENKQLLSGVIPPVAASVNRGDFLISRANTSELVAKCVVVENAPKMLILSDKIVRLQLSGECDKKFLCITNNSAEYARVHYSEQASGTSLSMKNVSRSVIYELPIPLPPLAEQHRIVARVDELMALCDQIETQLTTTATDSRRLLEAVLRDAIRPQALPNASKGEALGCR